MRILNINIGTQACVQKRKFWLQLGSQKGQILYKKVTHMHRNYRKLDNNVPKCDPKNTLIQNSSRDEHLALE